MPLSLRGGHIAAEDGSDGQEALKGLALLESHENPGEPTRVAHVLLGSLSAH